MRNYGGGHNMRALSGFSRAITGIAAIAVVIGSVSAGGSALASTASHHPGVTASAGVAHPAASPVASPGISAPPDVVVGEADGQVALTVTLSAPGQNTVTVNYATADGTANGQVNSCAFPNSAYVDQSGTLTFPAGVTTQTVTVTLLDCHQSLSLGFLNFYLTLSSNSTDSSIVRAKTQVDITGDAAAASTPGLYVRSATVDAHAGSVQVPVVLGGPSGAAQGVPVTVHYATHDGSAKEGTDYKPVSGTLTFPPGETARNITEPILNRAGAAAARAFSVTLDTPSNATVAYGTSVVTIGASGAAAVGSPGIYAPPDAVAGENDGYVDLPVTLSAPGQGTVTVHYATADGTGNGQVNSCAFGTSAYVDQSGTLTFPPGVTTQTVRVPVLDCHQSLPLGFMNFYLTLSSNSVNSSIVRAASQIGITGDAAATSTPGLYVRSATVDAHAGSVQVPVVLGGPSGAAQGVPVTVHYATHDGSAKAGTDYTPVSGTLTFPPGETAQNITVPILNRTGAVAARSLSVTLDTPSNATVAYGTGVVTIGASGAAAVPLPGIYAPPDAVAGENDGYVDLPVTLSAPGQGTVTVHYATADGTGNGQVNSCAFGTSAYVDQSGTLTFPPGVTTQTVRVPVLDCHQSLPLGFMNFYLTLSSNSVNSSIGRAITQVDVTGDAAAASTPGLSAGNAIVDARAGSVQVPVVLGGPSGLAQGVPVTVKYSTHDGSAKAGTDYSALSGTLTFPPGQTAQTITVPILNRAGAAAARSFAVTLAAPSNATVADGTGIVTIGASGAAAVASPFINAPQNVVVGETNGYVDLPVTLSAPGQRTVTVHYATADGTANGQVNSCAFATSAYVDQSGTLTFTPGVTTQTVRVPILDCGTSSPLTFGFALSSPTGGSLGVAAGTITIVLPAKVPSAPSGVTATAGNQQASVRFAAPASDGGSPVNSYRVTASPGGATATGFSSPITVTGLHNGTVYTFRVTATNAVGSGPASGASNPVLPENFAAKPGALTDIAVGANGAVWAVGAANVAGGHPIYQWNGSKWVTVAGGAVVIAVDQHGNPWIVNSSHKIFRRSGTKWAALPGSATDISIGADGAVWAVGTASISGGHPIYHWTGSKWVTVAGAAVVIAVDPQGNPWIVNSSHKISHRSGTKWVAVAGSATDIASGANGSVWDVGTDTVSGGHTVSERIGAGWTNSSGGAVTIAVDPHGNPWIVNSSHHVFLG